jgi:hypothetical protein
MTKENLVDIMRELAQVRPVFHSEADFQLELGYLIKSKKLKVRLERPFYLKENVKFELDIEVGGTVAIELKYKKSPFNKKIEGEEFNLKHDKAITNSRYDIVNDARRVRDLVDSGHHSQGFTIFLTNTEAYWKSDAKGTKAEQFDLTGKKKKFVENEKWQLIKTKTKSRNQPIEIKFNDEINWVEYRIGPEEEHDYGFRFIVIDVNDPLVTPAQSSKW